MKIIRFATKNIKFKYGWIFEDMVGEIEGDPFGEFRRFEPEYQLDEVELLPPCLPSKIICVGRNYLEHVKEHHSEVPDIPLLFLKPPSSVISHGKSIILPPQSKNVEQEAELAVVIRKQGRWITPENALNYVFGYTIGNDVTARDIQRSDLQWTRGKGFDTFCPLGPWIETEFDPSDALITCHVNGNLRQMASTRDMMFSTQQLISFASTVMTLFPGDIILTGTPAGVGPLREGDVVSIQIEGIGSLSNPVVNEIIPNM